MSLENKIKLLIDANRGIYIPELFAQCTFENSNKSELLQEFEGIEKVHNENYWEDWSIILDSFWFIDNNIKYTLYDNGDLWAIPANLTDEEREELNQWN